MWMWCPCWGLHPPCPHHCSPAQPAPRWTLGPSCSACNTTHGHRHNIMVASWPLTWWWLSSPGCAPGPRWHLSCHSDTPCGNSSWSCPTEKRRGPGWWRSWSTGDNQREGWQWPGCCLGCNQEVGWNMWKSILAMLCRKYFSDFIENLWCCSRNCVSFIGYLKFWEVNGFINCFPINFDVETRTDWEFADRRNAFKALTNFFQQQYFRTCKGRRDAFKSPTDLMRAICVTQCGSQQMM